MPFIWLGFLLLVLAMLAADLFIVHRKPHAVSIREALWWSAVWAGLAMLFTVFIYFGYEHHWLGLGTGIDAVDGSINDGRSAAVKYVTGYVVQKTLSGDNL